MKAGKILLAFFSLSALLAAAPEECKVPKAEPGAHGPITSSGRPMVCEEKEEADPCKDLFHAACHDKEHQFRQHDIEKQADRLINDAMHASITAMGGKSIEKSYFDFCRDQGHPLRDDLTESQRKAVVDSSAPPGELDSYFTSIQPACPAELPFSEEQKKRILELRQIYADAALPLFTAQEKMAKASAALSPAQPPKLTSNPEQERARSAAYRAEYTAAKKEADALLKITTDTQKEMNEINKSAFVEADRLAQEWTKKTKAIFQKKHVTLIADISAFCSTTIPQKMVERRKDVEAAQRKAKENPASPEIPNLALLDLKPPPECRPANLYRLRAEAIEIFRLGETPEAEKKTKELVEKNFPIYLRLRELDARLAYEPTERYVAKAGALRPLDEDIAGTEKALIGYHPACLVHRSLVANEITGLHDKFFSHLARAKPTIEAVLKTAYTDKQKELMDKLYRQAHDGVLDYVQNELGAMPKLRGTPRLAKIEKSMRELNYFWPKMPPDSFYKKQKDFPLPLLDLENLPDNDSFFPRFGDPQLSGFKEVNASYHSAVHVGDTKFDEHVNLLPTITFLAEKDPIATMAIIAHEIGHKVGYLTSKTNGYDLTGEYKALVDCLMSKESIGMKKNQADEAIADWISAKVMGRMLMNLPEKERAKSALRIAGFFCETEGGRYYNGDINLGEAHPDSALRVNGIFGANSLVRKAIPCPGDKAKSRYQECSLTGPVL